MRQRNCSFHSAKSSDSTWIAAGSRPHRTPSDCSSEGHQPCSSMAKIRSLATMTQWACLVAFIAPRVASLERRPRRSYVNCSQPARPTVRPLDPDRVSRSNSVQSSGVLHPMRMLLPLGSVSVNSCMPHGMSATGVTRKPAATSRACQSSTSSVMM